MLTHKDHVICKDGNASFIETNMTNKLGLGTDLNFQIIVWFVFLKMTKFIYHFHKHLLTFTDILIYCHCLQDSSRYHSLFFI